ncbi:hypothetical protein BV898_06508 [Hypsibius exemplaris]|uniref:DUF4419 domain-containing protein n=1 Tax=Hypsibius exemplaris TaxID=2072580 RepID=A0A1W0WWF7_HYPEX|nr:hypothetical protein BV898_06508 [Hypsibius exemplaris]
MPVTFYPSTQPLSPVAEYRVQYQNTYEPRTILNGATGHEISQTCKDIFQSSFGDNNTRSVIPSNNGFVYASIKAYNNHHKLVLRPDDVWITILTQLSLYVNAHAEELRHLFVTHQGKKELEVTATGSRYTVDFGNLAEQMGHLIQKNVIDPSLRKWIIPDFTTTTSNDRIVSSVIMMATLKAYFSYGMSLSCGLPEVTLLGEREDWQKLLTRLDKLPSFGNETSQWAKLLKPVLTRFVSAFDQPDSKENKDFWQTIVHYKVGGSGPDYLSGWITAFCFFSDKGKVLYRKTEWSNDSDEFEYIGSGNDAPKKGKKLGFQLDGVKFHRLDADDIPSAYAQVDVKLNDNGQKINTMMVAGMMGYRVSDSEKTANGHDGKNDSLQPVAGWWICDKAEVPPQN